MGVKNGQKLSDIIYVRSLVCRLSVSICCGEDVNQLLIMELVDIFQRYCRLYLSSSKMIIENEKTIFIDETYNHDLRYLLMK